MKKTFLEHFSELRKRILLSILALVLFSILSYPFSGWVLNKIKRDIIPEYQLYIFSPLEAIVLSLKISILLGFFLSSPIFLFEFLSFIEPAMKRNEKKLLLITLFSSMLLFLLGLLFSYLLLIPITLKILIEFSLPVATPLLSLEQTFDFIISMMLIFGIVFQLPLIIGILTKLKFLNPRELISKRSYAIVLIFLIAAIITPDTSGLTQILVAIPMILIYEMSILISKNLK
ncbi:MAG: twin-arginine translocase subunit TatC [Candidatus Altiarchaeota archaeon]